MATAAPRVSIIVATYNWSSVLPFSIGSGLDQTFRDFELLVVGDGCTDDSAEVVRSISDSRVRWIGLPHNSGHQSAPNNEGLKQARGEIIAYLGHDDLWLPNHLAAALAAIDRGADLTHSIIRWVSPNPRDDPFCLLQAYTPGHFIPPSSVVHRRSVTEQVGGWRDYRTIAEPPDNDLWRRMHEAGFQFAFVPQVTVVKLPAALRSNVYRERPCYEQAEWLERIRTDPDLGSRELVRAFCGHVPPRRMPYRQLLGHLGRETWLRLWRRIKPPPPPIGLATYVEETRRIKGLSSSERNASHLATEPATGDDP